MGCPSASHLSELAARILFRTVADEAADLQNSWIGDGVEDVIAVTAAADQTSIVQGLQMSRHIRLIAANTFGYVTDWRFTLLEDLQDPKPQGLPERSKPGSNNFYHSVAQWQILLTFGHDGPHYMNRCAYAQKRCRQVRPFPGD
jgi:hypothetical protein